MLSWRHFLSIIIKCHDAVRALEPWHFSVLAFISLFERKSEQYKQKQLWHFLLLGEKCPDIVQRTPSLYQYIDIAKVDEKYAEYECRT